jgi:protein-L-isoaspartate(D-aspartate) O-methyltransferase
MEAVLVRHGGDVNAAAVESLFETELDYLQGAEPVPQFRF